MCRSSHQRWITMPLLFGALTAHAIPPPPLAPRQLREARMTVTVQLVEASQGQVNRLTKLCTVSGKIPVYADDGRATRANGREIQGCKMQWKGKNLTVSVRGAVAVAHGPFTFAIADVGVVPPDAKPGCPDVCGPQPLADSRGEIRVSGAPHSLKFSLSPNPVSILNATPTVWLEADVEVAN
jgi:hypothetical protein